MGNIGYFALNNGAQFSTYDSGEHKWTYFW
jgi:hypothetical protein